MKGKEKTPIIQLMKLIKRALKDSNQIIFMDFEGTQLTQEIIAIGAVKVTLDNKNFIKKVHNPFKIYILAEGVVGPIVTSLTGITDIFLFEHGETFINALQKFKKYCGENLTHTSFMTYGTFDMRLLHQTSLMNKCENDELIQEIYRKNIDFSNILSKYCRSSRNEMLSLNDALRKFNITPRGDAHDPQFDAMNLSFLYNAFLKEKNILKDEYYKVLTQNPKLPVPVSKLLHKLLVEGTITEKDFMNFIEEDLR